MAFENTSGRIVFRPYAKALCVLGLGLGFALSATSCGTSNKTIAPTTNESADAVRKDERVARLQQEMVGLKDTQNKLSGLVFSDFATCPASGETADALIQKMCKVAQAATAEARVELKGELAGFSKELESQVANLSNDVGQLSTAVSQTSQQVIELTKRISDAEATVKTLSTNLSNLEIRVSSTETAIVALQASLSSLKVSIPGLLESIDIGAENIAAGPVYETILRRNDRTQVVGFRVQMNDPLNLVASDPMEVAVGKDIANFSQGGDGLAVSDVINFTSCSAGNGLTTRDVNGELEVVSVGATKNGFTPFSIKLRRARDAKGGASNLGGSLCVGSKVSARGMAILWESSNGTDTKTRIAQAGSRKYNYIIRQVNKDWSVCYDRTNSLATFEVLNAVGSSVICK